MARVPPSGLFRNSWSRFIHNDQVVLTLLAVAIGIVVAYGEIAFRQLIHIVQTLFYGLQSEAVFLGSVQLVWWHMLAIPAAGGLVVGLFLHFAVPGRRARTPADVIEANAMENGRISMRVGLTTALTSAVSLGVGASAGREGPVVHLGGSIASWMTQKLNLDPALARTILGCGVAAAVSCAFNAPLAGVFFALEVVLGHYALQAFAPIVIASVVGAVVSRIHLGDTPAFSIPDYTLGSFLELPAFILLGIICAGVAIALMASIVKTEDRFDGLGWPIWARVPVAGLLVGAMAIYYPQVLGVGYEATDSALNELLPLTLLLALIVAKIVATGISIGGGFGGGVFSPSLFLGAMTGGAFGLIAATALPELTASSGVYAIVGMSAVSAAVLGAPISTILIVFEITGDYQLVIAVMVGTSVASVVTQQTLGKSFFHWQLERRGLFLQRGRAGHLMQTSKVSDFMTPEVIQIAHDASLDEVREALGGASIGRLAVVDGEGRLAGVVGYKDLGNAPAGNPGPPTASDLARGDFVTLEPDESLGRALARLEEDEPDHVVVVESRATMKVIGLFHHKRALLAVTRELRAAQREEK